MKKGILMAVLLGLFMVGCSDKKAAGTTGNAAGEKVYKIGITQIVAHPALDKARDGFKKAFEEAGIPKGVLNTITGKGSEIGDFVVEHKGINFITLTYK